MLAVENERSQLKFNIILGPGLLAPHRMDHRNGA